MSKIAAYQTNRVDYTSISPDSYISTENMLPNCEGVVSYNGTPNVESVIEYRKGDILVSNIRPYLQKIWIADRNGGCNPDVLVIRINDTSAYDPLYVYYALRRKAFFDHMMSDKSGVKMPRGNKINNLKFMIPDISFNEQKKFVSKALEYENIISAAKETMESAQKRKKELVRNYIFNKS